MQTATGRPMRQGALTALGAFLTLVYALTVRDLRTEHRNATLGILLSVAMPLVTGLVFFAAMQLMGFGMGKVRGDDLTFVLIGFVLFFTHVRTVGAVAGALRRDMMNHQRLTPMLMVCVRGFGALYKNALALAIMLAANWLGRGVWEMADGVLFVSAFLACWAGGIAVGTVFLAVTHYLSWGGVLHTAYVRVMFFTSGKFFVANTMPGFLRPWMEWNPLFHLLDQGRAGAFLNYTARTTSVGYAVAVFLGVLVIAMLLEAHVRRNYSASHMAGG